MDIVYIKDLTVHTVIGIHDWERVAPRPLILNIEMAKNCRVAAASDNINDALDYFAVSELLIAFAEKARFELIERFAEEAAKAIQAQFGVSWLSLDVAKPGAIGAAVSVGVKIERGQRG